MTFRRSLALLLLCLMALAPALQAQVQVGLELKRRLYMAYEPVLATVTIRNLSGRDLPLADEGETPWFGFQIVRGDGSPVAALADTYKLEPFILPAGQTVRRRVHLNNLYPIYDYGLYRIRATVYFSPLQKFFESTPRNIEISEGRTFWQQIVGVPEGTAQAGSGTRQISAMRFTQSDVNHLYIRIQDPETGTVYCTTPVGKLVTGMEPDLQIDAANQLHVLQVVGPKTYLHTQFGLNGELLQRETYHAVKNRPALKRDATGNLTVRGGRRESEQVAQNQMGTIEAENRGVPKLSDRPPNLPKE